MLSRVGWMEKVKKKSFVDILGVQQPTFCDSVYLRLQVMVAWTGLAMAQSSCCYWNVCKWSIGLGWRACSNGLEIQRYKISRMGGSGDSHSPSTSAVLSLLRQMYRYVITMISKSVIKFLLCKQLWKIRKWNCIHFCIGLSDLLNIKTRGGETLGDVQS